MKRDKIIAECNFILSNGAPTYLSAIKNINDYFVSLIIPKNLDGGSSKNVVIQFQIHFSELCIALMANGVANPKKLTVMDFYSALKYFDNKKNKTQKQ